MEFNVGTKINGIWREAGDFHTWYRISAIQIYSSK